MSNSTQQSFSLGLGEVEAALGDMSGIKRSRQGSFQSRLKNLFKVGFLSHVGSGRGRAGRYGAGDVFQLALAAELMQFELGPHRIKDTMARLESVISQAAIELGEFFAAGMTLPGFEATLYLSFDPGGLVDLARDYGEDAPPTERIYRGQQPIEDKLARRLAVINLTRLCTDLADALAAHGSTTQQAFGYHLANWAKSRNLDEA